MKKNREFIMRTIGEDTVLIPVGQSTRDFNGLITMNEPTAFIWEQIDQVDSFEALVDKITETYDVDRETARRDAYGIVSRMVRNGLIVPTREDHTW